MTSRYIPILHGRVVSISTGKDSVAGSLFLVKQPTWTVQFLELGGKS